MNSAASLYPMSTFVEECCELCLDSNDTYMIGLNRVIIVYPMPGGMLAARPPAHHAMTSEGPRGAN